MAVVKGISNLYKKIKQNKGNTINIQLMSSNATAERLKHQDIQYHFSVDIDLQITIMVTHWDQVQIEENLIQELNRDLIDLNLNQKQLDELINPGVNDFMCNDDGLTETMEKAKIEFNEMLTQKINEELKLLKQGKLQI